MSHGKDRCRTVFKTLIRNTSHNQLQSRFNAYTGRCKQWYWCWPFNGAVKVLWTQHVPPKSMAPSTKLHNDKTLKTHIINVFPLILIHALRVLVCKEYLDVWEHKTVVSKISPLESFSLYIPTWYPMVRTSYKSSDRETFTVVFLGVYKRYHKLYSILFWHLFRLMQHDFVSNHHLLHEYTQNSSTAINVAIYIQNYIFTMCLFYRL